MSPAICRAARQGHCQAVIVYLLHSECSASCLRGSNPARCAGPSGSHDPAVQRARSMTAAIAVRWPGVRLRLMVDADAAADHIIQLTRAMAEQPFCKQVCCPSQLVSNTVYSGGELMGARLMGCPDPLHDGSRASWLHTLGASSWAAPRQARHVHARVQRPDHVSGLLRHAGTRRMPFWATLGAASRLKPRASSWTATPCRQTSVSCSTR